MTQKKVLYLGLDPSHYKTDGQVTHLPLIDIIPTPIHDLSIQESFEQFKTYTHVIVTSKTSVQIMANYLPHFGYAQKDWEAKNTLAIGRVTAHYLKQIGIKPFIIAKEETAEGIVAEIGPIKDQDSHFFWPHSALSRSVISEFFKSHSIQLTECLLYRPCTRFPSQLIHPHEFDEIIFTSPSTVKAFLEVFKHFPQNTQLTPIGPVTAAYLHAP